MKRSPTVGKRERKKKTKSRTWDRSYKYALTSTTTGVYELLYERSRTRSTRKKKPDDQISLCTRREILYKTRIVIFYYWRFYSTVWWPACVFTKLEQTHAVEILSVPLRLFDSSVTESKKKQYEIVTAGSRFGSEKYLYENDLRPDDVRQRLLFSTITPDISSGKICNRR